MKAGLLVFSLVHRSVTRFKNIVYDRGWAKVGQAPLPVTSIGSLALGGMGKTPVAMEALRYLISRGLRTALVTRGYKGAWEERGGVLSDGRQILGDWRQAGDEAYLAARRCPLAGVFVGKRRYLSCLRAKAAGFDLAVLDDGFQHRKLGRDLDIVIFDPAEKTALREPLSGLKRAHLIVLPENTGADIQAKISARFPAAKVARLATRPRAFHPVSPRESEDGLALDRWRGRRVMAFCGIARPERFFSMLEGLDLRLLDRIAFPDHHSYPAASWRRLWARAEVLRPEAVVTTEKDAVKLMDRPDLSDSRAGRADLPALYALRIEPELSQQFYRALDALLEAKSVGRK